MGAERIIARFVLQAKSPLMIAGGEEDPLWDNSLARDANGLPVLPATGIAGALRALLPDADAWFGYQRGDEGGRSALELNDGLFHWSDNIPRDGLLLDDAAMRDDPLCKVVLEASPVRRDHVRLNTHGVVEGEGKFDRSAVPAGARFTFELRGKDAAMVEEAAEIVKGGLWLGGAGRSGYGRMDCVAMGIEALDLATPEGRARHARIAGHDIGENSPIVVTYEDFATRQGQVWRLEGQIEGPLLVGGPGRDDREDRAPYREKRIVWEADKGTVRERVVVPASAVKGALRHRVAYRLDDKGAESLFGQANGNVGASAGKLRFHDFVLPEAPSMTTLTHVGLDRFTGGARRGVLFTDAMLWRPSLSIEIEEVGGDQALTAPERKALRKALDDMAAGLCGIGAEWGEGAGVFETADVTEPEVGA